MCGSWHPRASPALRISGRSGGGSGYEFIDSSSALLTADDRNALQAITQWSIATPDVGAIIGISSTIAGALNSPVEAAAALPGHYAQNDNHRMDLRPKPYRQPSSGSTIGSAKFVCLQPPGQ
jgi:hypothetical protein